MCDGPCGDDDGEGATNGTAVNSIEGSFDDRSNQRGQFARKTSCYKGIMMFLRPSFENLLRRSTARRAAPTRGV